MFRILRRSLYVFLAITSPQLMALDQELVSIIEQICKISQESCPSSENIQDRIREFYKLHAIDDSQKISQKLLPMFMEHVLFRSYNKHVIENLPQACDNPVFGTTAKICFFGPYVLKTNFFITDNPEQDEYLMKLFHNEIFTLTNLKGLNENFHLEAYNFETRKIVLTRVTGPNILTRASAISNIEERREFLKSSNLKFANWLARYHALAPKNFNLKKTSLTNTKYSEIESKLNDVKVFTLFKNEISKIKDSEIKNQIELKYKSFIQNKPYQIFFTWGINDIDIANYYPEEDIIFDFNAASLAPLELDIASIVYNLYIKETDLICFNLDYTPIKTIINEFLENFVKSVQKHNSSFFINYNLVRLFLSYKLIQGSHFVDEDFSKALLDRAVNLLNPVEEVDPRGKTIQDLVGN